MPVRMGAKKDSSLHSTNRLQRNQAEKQRRDKLNSFISELASIVPLVSMSAKRLDKTSILRLSAAHLRIYQSFLNGNAKKNSKSQSSWRPNYLDVDHLKSLLDAVEGFLLVTTVNGKILYASQAVEQFLGYQNIEMLGYSLFSFLHEDDVEAVKKEIEHLASIAPEDTNEKWISPRLSFYCRIREYNQPRSEVVTHQLVHIVGHMTTNSDFEKNSNLKSGSPNELLFKAFIRVGCANTLQEIALYESSQEYVTRHSLDGTIIHSDQRISTIIGFLPDEVYMKNAYEFIIPNDVPTTQFAQRLMFSSTAGTGSVTYRILTRTNGFVYLTTTGTLIFDKTTGQLDHFVCVNRQLSEEEGEKELKKFVEEFSPYVIPPSRTKTFSVSSSTSGYLTSSEHAESDSRSPISVVSDDCSVSGVLQTYVPEASSPSDSVLSIQPECSFSSVLDLSQNTNPYNQQITSELAECCSPNAIDSPGLNFGQSTSAILNSAGAHIVACRTELSVGDELSKMAGFSLVPTQNETDGPMAATVNSLIPIASGLAPFSDDEAFLSSPAASLSSEYSMSPSIASSSDTERVFQSE